MERKLHIGGRIARDGWEILDALEGEVVDHVGNANDLSRFEDGTFNELYASHVLEHFDYVKEVARVLKEWLRVLEPGGKIHIGVPNWDILCQMVIARDQLTFDERFWVMRTILGGHTNEYDYHYSGYTFDILEGFMRVAGFQDIRKVDSFGLFHDTTEMVLKGVNISLNVTANKSE